MSSELGIREAKIEDAEAVRGLAIQLGYEPPMEEVKAAIQNVAGHTVLVADRGETIVGWIELSVQTLLTSGREGWICGLVVDESCRGEGIGKKLCLAAEEWARKLSLTGIRVRSRLSREKAHQFYLRLGYEEYKRQAVFRKDL